MNMLNFILLPKKPFIKGILNHRTHETDFFTVAFLLVVKEQFLVWTTSDSETSKFRTSGFNCDQGTVNLFEFEIWWSVLAELTLSSHGVSSLS